MKSRLWVVLLFLVTGGVALGEEDLVAALGSPDAAVRNAARAELKTAGAESLDQLQAGLASGHPLVIAASADLISELGLHAARDELNAAAREGRADPLVLDAVCRALGRVGLAGRAAPA